MRVFVTGATGFIGSALTTVLIGAGHDVLGLTRSVAGAAALEAAGAEVHHGSLEDLASLERGAAAAEAVIHLAFNHDFSRWAENCEADRGAIEALGGGLAGSGGPLIVTSGTGAAMTPGRLTTEQDPPNSPIPRVASEQAAAQVQAKGVDVRIVRLPQVHDPVKQGLITPLVAIAREQGISAYVGDGQNRWPAVHVDDAARLYRLALENGKAGARYNAVGEEGVTLRSIAEAIGRGLKLPVVAKSPEQAAQHFGWMAMLIGADAPASSTLTQTLLDWHPTGPTLMEDLAQARF